MNITKFLSNKVCDLASSKVDRILSDFNKTLNRLEKFMVQADAIQKANNAEIEMLQQQNAVLKAEATRAQNAFNKIKEITGE